jgi:hypothetical protein
MRRGGSYNALSEGCSLGRADPLAAGVVVDLHKPGLSGIRTSLWDSPMPTSNRSVSHPCSARVSATSRTAVYGPVRTVVWEGRSREAPPYPDLWPITSFPQFGPCPQLVEPDMTAGAG